MTTSLMLVPQLQPAGVGGDAQHALAGRVVDEQLGLAQDAAGFDQFIHVVSAEVALAQLVAIDAGLAAQQTLGQLDPRLFQADEENRLLLVHGDVADQLRAKAVLPTLAGRR